MTYEIEYGERYFWIQKREILQLIRFRRTALVLAPISAQFYFQYSFKKASQKLYFEARNILFRSHYATIIQLLYNLNGTHLWSPP